VGSRGQAEDEDSSALVAEAGDGTGPVGLVLVSTALGFAYSAAVSAKPGAALAGNDGFVDLLKERRVAVGRRHCIP
jgi:hypothetical protein